MRHFDYGPGASNGSEGPSVQVVSRWLRPGNRTRTFLEVASMMVTGRIVACLRSESNCTAVIFLLHL